MSSLPSSNDAIPLLQLSDQTRHMAAVTADAFDVLAEKQGWDEHTIERLTSKLLKMSVDAQRSKMSVAFPKRHAAEAKEDLSAAAAPLPANVMVLVGARQSGKHVFASAVALAIGQLAGPVSCVPTHCCISTRDIDVELVASDLARLDATSRRKQARKNDSIYLRVASAEGEVASASSPAPAILSPALGAIIRHETVIECVVDKYSFRNQDRMTLMLRAARFPAAVATKMPQNETATRPSQPPAIESRKNGNGGDLLTIWTAAPTNFIMSVSAAPIACQPADVFEFNSVYANETTHTQGVDKEYRCTDGYLTTEESEMNEEGAMRHSQAMPGVDESGVSHVKLTAALAAALVRRVVQCPGSCIPIMSSDDMKHGTGH